MAMMTENLNLQRGILKRLESVSVVKFIDATKVENIQNNSNDASDWPVVKTADGRSLRSRLLVS